MSDAPYGLSPRAHQAIYDQIRGAIEVEEAVLYGSRAMGNCRPGSDIDLTIKGMKLDLEILNALATNLDDLLLPYSIDLSIYDKIDNSDLKLHIDRVGKVFYRR